MKRAIVVMALVAACGGTEDEAGRECFEYEPQPGAWDTYCVDESFLGDKFCWQTDTPCQQPDGDVRGEWVRCMYVRDLNADIGKGVVESECMYNDVDCRRDIVNNGAECE